MYDNNIKIQIIIQTLVYLETKILLQPYSQLEITSIIQHTRT